MSAVPWRRLVRPGDAVVVAAGALFVTASTVAVWQGGTATRAVVRVEGKVVSELDLAVRKTVSVNGALGPTVVRVEAGRARVVSDPGPRQYCVRQGWLSRPGELAICAPSKVSLQIVGNGPALDSLAY